MGHSVLIVDDSFVIRSGMEAYLNGSGNWDEVYVAENGKEGVQLAVEKEPDIVSFDVEMPIMDGLTALKEIKKLQKNGKFRSDTHVIILSATMHENEANVRKARLLGASDVMAKPDGKSATVMLDMKSIEARFLALL